MYALGRHLLLELKDCRPEALANRAVVEKAMVDAATEARATILGHSFHEFHPAGISGVVIIAESHLSIHTWPEHNFAAIDIFMCGDTLQPEAAVRRLIEALGSRNPSLVEVKRGILGVDADAAWSSGEGLAARGVGG